MAREYVPIPLEYLETYSMLEDAEFGNLVRAILRYADSGIEEDYSDRVLAISFAQMKSKEDYYEEYYEQQSILRKEKASKAATARWNKRMLDDAQECSSIHEHENDACDAKYNTIQNNTIQYNPIQFNPIGRTEERKKKEAFVLPPDWVTGCEDIDREFAKYAPKEEIN